MYLFFLTMLTANILTSLLHPNWKKTVSFLFSMLKYFVQTVNFPPLFIVNLLLLVFSPISTALFPLIFNLCFSYKHFHAQLEVEVVSLPPCSIILFVASLIKSSNLRPLFTQFREKLSISAFSWAEGFAVTYSITDRTRVSLCLINNFSYS